MPRRAGSDGCWWGRASRSGWPEACAARCWRSGRSPASARSFRRTCRGIERLSIDGPVLAVATAISILAALVFGVVPAATAARTDPGDLLRESGTRVSGGRRIGRAAEPARRGTAGPVAGSRHRCRARGAIVHGPRPPRARLRSARSRHGEDPAQRQVCGPSRACRVLSSAARAAERAAGCRARRARPATAARGSDRLGLSVRHRGPDRRRPGARTRTRTTSR